MVSQAKPQTNEGKIIPLVLGKGQRFPGIELLLTLFFPPSSSLFCLYIYIIKFIYFNWRILGNIVIVFAKHQHEPAMGIYVPPQS